MISILQINLGRSSHHCENALDYAVQNNIDLLIVQEPPIKNSSTLPNPLGPSPSTSHSAFHQLLPQHSGLRPRVMAYVSKTCPVNIAVDTEFPSDPDCMALLVQGPNINLTLFNIYNEENQAEENNTRTIDRLMPHLSCSDSAIYCGDFNAHHPFWNPICSHPLRSEPVFDLMDKNALHLVNTPGEVTFWPTGRGSPTVLDLTLATTDLEERISGWHVDPEVYSDHFGILFSLDLGDLDSSSPSSLRMFNTGKADWDKFHSTLQLANWEPIALPEDSHAVSADILSGGDSVYTMALDSAATRLTALIVNAAKESIPLLRPCAKSKPWWTSSLTQLRKDVAKASRLAFAAPEELHLQLQAKKLQYELSDAIKLAKQSHWNTFLENESPENIFKAMAYTKPLQSDQVPPIQRQNGTLATSFPQQASALKAALFPTPPSSTPPSWNNYSAHPKWHWPSLLMDELLQACNDSHPNKAPGPDGISFAILQQAIGSIPDAFLELYAALLNIGYHPKPWRVGTGIILRKPNKPDYSAPKAYRVISLLNCLGKLMEKVLAKRLSFLAESTDLLMDSQVGGRLGKSAVDAALALTTHIQMFRKPGWTSSALFLDIKGAFDHVSKEQLLNILHDLALPFSLCSWVASFLSDRKLKLSFNNHSESPQPISTGIPQGSPISPILFLIYIRNLFKDTDVTVLSYIDDIALVTSSRSVEGNISKLQTSATHLFAQGSVNAIQFDPSKSELCHFGSARQPKTSPLLLPDGTQVTPSPVVRWLGIWFDSRLTFNHHVQIKVQQATQAFYRMHRLANTQRGLSPKAIRQLYLACVTSVADYGSPVWWKGQPKFASLLQKLQNKAMRLILGVFRTSPINAMQLEAGLLPVELRLDKSSYNYALRLTSMSANHPLTQLSSHLRSTPRLASTQLHALQDLLLEFPEISEELSQDLAPPWPTSSLKVNISKLDKDTAALHHLSTLNQIPSNALIYYTDGSKLQNGLTGAGAILWDKRTRKAAVELKYSLGQHHSVFDAELKAIELALDHAHDVSTGQEIHIFSDSQAALMRLKSHKASPGQTTLSAIENLMDIIKLLRPSTEICFHWCPGHKELDGNEHADAIAKAAAEEPCLDPTISLTQLKAELKQKVKQQWVDAIPNLTFSDNYKRTKTSLTPSMGLKHPTSKRSTLSAFFQLKIGHGFFNSYLHRFGKRDDPFCSCSRTPQTPSHLLLSCRLYRRQRKDLFEDLNVRCITLPLLLDTKSSMEAVLKFLEGTKISTRQCLGLDDAPAQVST